MKKKFTPPVIYGLVLALAVSPVSASIGDNLSGSLLEAVESLDARVATQEAVKSLSDEQDARFNTIEKELKKVQVSTTSVQYSVNSLTGTGVSVEAPEYALSSLTTKKYESLTSAECQSFYEEHKGEVFKDTESGYGMRLVNCKDGKLVWLILADLGTATQSGTTSDSQVQSAYNSWLSSQGIESGVFKGIKSSEIKAPWNGFAPVSEWAIVDTTASWNYFTCSTYVHNGTYHNEYVYLYNGKTGGVSSAQYYHYDSTDGSSNCFNVTAHLVPLWVTQCMLYFGFSAESPKSDPSSITTGDLEAPSGVTQHLSIDESENNLTSAVGNALLTGSAGGSFSIPYTCTMSTKRTESVFGTEYQKYVDVVIRDGEGSILYFGRIDRVRMGDNVITFTLPDDLETDTEYLMQVFSETCYEGSVDSTISEPVNMKLVIGE